MWLYNIFDIIFKKEDGLPHIQRTYKVKFCSKCAAPSVDRRAQSAGAREEMSQKAHARRERLLRKRMHARCTSVGWNTRAPVTNGRERKSGWISLNSPVN
jgi:hypothetical protein